MTKHIFAIAIACIASNAFAQQADECFAPEQIVRLKEKLARHNWQIDVDRPALPKDRPYFPYSLMGKYPTSCIALAVDETGKVKNAVVYFPRNARMSRDERNDYLRSAYTPGQIDGVAVPSVVILTITNAVK